MDMNKIAEFIRKQKVAFICSIDENGFPNVKAMLKPRKAEGLKQFYLKSGRRPHPQPRQGGDECHKLQKKGCLPV